MLCSEYNCGVGGATPVKTFTKEERGTGKFYYYKRNVLWSLVIKIVNRGCSTNDNIDKIYQSYAIFIYFMIIPLPYSLDSMLYYVYVGFT